MKEKIDYKNEKWGVYTFEKEQEIHIIPINDSFAHVSPGGGCWCKPEIEFACQDCINGCHLCDEGFISIEEIDVDEVEIEGCLVITHNAADERE